MDTNTRTLDGSYGGNPPQKTSTIIHSSLDLTMDDPNDDDPPKLPFVTVSDVLNQLNQNLKALSTADDFCEGRFELQKRLPDGSTIPASPADIAYSDLQTKLDQCAKFVASLSQKDKAIWAEDQRHVGNAYFHKAEYQTAMDIYLTCLLVKEDTAEHLNQTLLPVLNNLAQCTLQLGMHKKTIEFCNIALEEIAKYRDVDPLSTCKIYFKRAKARRLTGSYFEARHDLNQASSCLHLVEDVAPFQQALDKEYRCLKAAENEAQKNEQRQKQGLQKEMSAKSRNANDSAAIKEFDQGTTQPIRQYSSLRKRELVGGPPNVVPKEDPPMSYLQYYCLIAAKVSESLLLWLRDRETKNK